MKAYRGAVWIFFLLLSAGAVLPLWGQTWQQKYCVAPTTRPTPIPTPIKCTGTCRPGYHVYGAIPTMTPGEFLCRCVLDGTPEPTPAPPSYVHVHAVDVGSTETIVDSGTASYPVAEMGESVTLVGCNFGQSGTIESRNSAGAVIGSEQPSPTGNIEQPWSDTQIWMTVIPSMATQSANNSPTSVGNLDVKASGGMSNVFQLYIECPQPEIASVSPSSIIQGGTLQVTGCGFGTQNKGTVTLVSTETIVSTQSGPAGEVYKVTAVSSWSYNGVSFQVPASTPPGTYHVTVNGASSPGTITITAGNNGSTTPSASSTFGTSNTQTQQFTPLAAGSAAFQSLATPLTGNTIGLSPPSSQVWAATNTQTSIPVLVENYSNANKPQTVQLMIWQDLVPLQCDPNGPAHMSPDGNLGSWQNLGSAQTVAVGATLSTILIPVTLNPGLNYIEINGSAAGAPPAPNQGKTESAAQCPSSTSAGQAPPFNPTSTSSNAYPNNMLGNWVQEVVVLPVYTVTLDAMPYTIIYAPPGDQSNSKVSKAITTSIQYKIGGGTKTSNSNSDSENTCISASLTIVGFGPSYQSCSTQTDTGESDFSTPWTGSNSTSTTSGATWSVGNITSLVPAPPSNSSTYRSWEATYANEPFWYDGYVFLLSPQYAVYADGINADFRLLPGQNVNYSAPVPVAFLAACAAGLSAPTGSAFSPTSNPCAITSSIVLTPQEALNALALDPFYPNGQSTDPTGGCVPSSSTPCRIQQVSSEAYAEDDPSNPTVVQYSATAQQSSEADSVANYTSTATSILSTTLGFTGKLDVPMSNGTGGGSGGGSISASGGITGSSTSTQTASVTITYQSSTIATSQQSTADQVTLADLDNAFLGSSGKPSCSSCHPPLSPPPTGQFSPIAYWDTIYGTLLFRDPYAATAPSGVTQDQIKKLLPGILQNMQTYLKLHPPAITTIPVVKK